MKSFSRLMVLSAVFLSYAACSHAQYTSHSYRQPKSLLETDTTPPPNGQPRPAALPVLRPRLAPRSQPARYASLGFYPLANFDTGGLFTQTGNAGTDNRFGGLVSLDLGVEDQVTKIDKVTKTKYGEIHGRYEIGGWYWTTGSEDLYEIHLRAVSEGGFGIQAGYLNSTKGFLPKPGPNTLKTDATAFDFFLIYDLNSHHLIPMEKRKNKSYRPWNIEVGIGTYVDASTHYINNFTVKSNEATANFTYFVTGSLQLTDQISVTVSEWNFRDRYQDLNRVAAGINFTF